MQRIAIAAILAALCLSSCTCGDPPPIDETFDGNIVIGDATPAPDAEPPDRGLTEDAALDGSEEDAFVEDATEDGGDDAGPDAGDAAPEDAGIDCNVTAVATLSSSDAVAMAATYAGMIVDVTGTATIAAESCTELECADGGSCCNTCTAVVTIDGVLPLASSECFGAPGCMGTECAQVCRPAVLGVPQRFRGRMALPASLQLFSVAP